MTIERQYTAVAGVSCDVSQITLLHCILVNDGDASLSEEGGELISACMGLRLLGAGYSEVSTASKQWRKISLLTVGFSPKCWTDF